MQKRLLINSNPIETRIALVEGTSLAEVHIERGGLRSIVGNIYKGRVLRVLPGMQAAFVDIGLEKAGFMHVSDFWRAPEDTSPPVDEGAEAAELAVLDEDAAAEEAADAAADNEAGNGHSGDDDDDDEEEESRPGAPSGSAPRTAPLAVTTAVTTAGGAAAERTAGERGLARLASRQRAEAGRAADLRADEGSAADRDEDSGAPRGQRDLPGFERGEATEAEPSTDAPAETSERAAAVLPASDGGEADEDRPDRPDQPRANIEDVLAKGQEILVQVSKEPIGNKGARITSHISLPGRYIVYMPTTDHVGVSRRIEDDKERQRLRETVSNARRPGDGGFIVRTACEGVSKREIVSDMRFLARLWKAIVKKEASASAPVLLHEDLDIVLRVIRDLFTADVTQLVVDRQEDFSRIADFVESALPQRFRTRVELYDGMEPVFDHFGIENQLNRALERRVWLKSGGYLVFDQTEALTTVDVNTGRFVGKKTQEDTVLKTNLEAAKVVVDQLRLRNIGGIIIIDFIDMEKAANRKKVSEALAEAVKKDKARTNILRISELGLVQMTRKRTRDNLRQLMTTPCATCAGDGRLRSVPTIAADVLRAVRRQCATAGTGASGVVLQVAGEVAEALRSTLRSGVEELEARIGAPVTIRTEPRFDRRHFEIRILPPGIDGSKDDVAGALAASPVAPLPDADVPPRDA